MGKASSSKKVARVARTGGGRTRRGSSTSWFWPVFVGIVVVLGTAGIVYSKDQRQPDNTRPRASANGVTGDHWHAAVGFDICGTFAPAISNQTDISGIHTHGDGVVHIHPFSSVSSGKNATLKVFFDTVKAKVDETDIQLPGAPAKKNGQKCGDKAAEVRIKTWPNRAPDTSGTTATGNPANIRPRDGELITIAFVPKDDDIPRPPSADQLDKLNDVGDQSANTTVPGDTASSTSTPGSTVAPAEGAATTAPGDTAPSTTPSSNPTASSTP
jgi:hypothetical protein